MQHDNARLHVVKETKDIIDIFDTLSWKVLPYSLHQFRPVGLPFWLLQHCLVDKHFEQLTRFEKARMIIIIESKASNFFIDF